MVRGMRGMWRIRTRSRRKRITHKRRIMKLGYPPQPPPPQPQVDSGVLSVGNGESLPGGCGSYRYTCGRGGTCQVTGDAIRLVLKARQEKGWREEKVEESRDNCNEGDKREGEGKGESEK